MSETLRWTADLMEKGFSRRFAFERERDHIAALLQQPLNGPAEITADTLYNSFLTIGRIASIREINTHALDMLDHGDIGRLLVDDGVSSDRALLCVSSLAGTVEMVRMGYARERIPNIRFFIEFTEHMGGTLAKGGRVIEQSIRRPAYRTFVESSCGCGMQIRDSISYSYNPDYVNTRGLGKLAADLTVTTPLCSGKGWDGNIPAPGQVSDAFLMASNVLAMYKRG